MFDASPTFETRGIIAYVRKSRRVRKGQPVASAGDQHRVVLDHIAGNGLPSLLNLPDMSAEYPGAFLDNESASKDDQGTDRPGWRATLAALRDGRADTLIVYGIDRASRMGLRQLMHELPPNVRLIAIMDGYDSARDDIGADVMLTVKAREARDYVGRLSANVRNAKDRQREAGEYSGPAPYGFKRQRDTHGKPYGKLVHDPDQWPTVLTAFELGAAGWSSLHIAKRLTEQGIPSAGGGTWHQNTVYTTLTNDIYAGWLTRRSALTGHRRERVLDDSGRPVWALADGTDPVPADLVQRARDALANHVRFPGHKTTVGSRLMSKRLACDGCGGPMSWNGTNYWRCSRDRTSPGSCPTGCSVRDDHVSALVCERVLSALSGLDPADESDAVALAGVAAAWFGETRTADAAELAEARRTVGEAKQRAARLRKAFLDGLFEDDPAEYERQNNALRRARETAAMRLAELESAAHVDVTWLTDPETLHAAWDDADTPTRRVILAASLAAVRVRAAQSTRHETRAETAERVDIRMRWEREAVTEDAQFTRVTHAA